MVDVGTAMWMVGLVVVAACVAVIVAGGWWAGVAAGVVVTVEGVALDVSMARRPPPADGESKGGVV